MEGERYGILRSMREPSNYYVLYRNESVIIIDPRSSPPDRESVCSYINLPFSSELRKTPKTMSPMIDGDKSDVPRAGRVYALIGRQSSIR